jgi:hypothetical protein
MCNLSTLAVTKGTPHIREPQTLKHRPSIQMKFSKPKDSEVPIFNFFPLLTKLLHDEVQVLIEFSYIQSY